MDAISKDNKTILETTVSSMNPLRPIQIKRALHQKRPDLAKAVCQTLGIEYNDLILKSKEEMYDPKKLKEANDLIYDHYLKKYYRRVAKVDAKIKEMIYLGKTDPHYLGDHLKQRCHSSSESYDRTVRIETRANRQETYQDYVCSTHSARPHHVAHKSLQRETDHDSFNEMRIESSDQEIATSIVNNYKKKLERVQENWDEQTKNLRNKPIGDPNRLLNHALQSQIDRLNRNVEKAEKYAQSIIDLNEKRKQIKNEILQRDLKVKKVKRKLVAERNDLTQKNREYYQEKMKDIKTQQREYNTKLRKKAGKMQQRFQELEEKLMKEEEERKEVVKVKELEFVAKVSKAKDMKDAEYEEIFKEHKNVELRSHRQVEMMLSERRRKCEESAKSFRESYDKAKEKRDNLTAEKDSKTIGKIFKKSQGTDHIRELIQASMKKKHEESIEKQEIHRKNYREIVNNKAQWSKNILKNFRKSEERLKEFQEEKTRTLVLKKELHNLKKLDQLESFSGIMKLREMRNSQIIDKERADSLKMNMLREQSLILSQARIDVDRRTKQKVDGMIHVALKEGPENKSVDHQRFHRAASAAQL